MHFYPHSIPICTYRVNDKQNKSEETKKLTWSLLRWEKHDTVRCSTSLASSVSLSRPIRINRSLVACRPLINQQFPFEWNSELLPLGSNIVCPCTPNGLGVNCSLSFSSLQDVNELIVRYPEFSLLTISLTLPLSVSPEPDTRGAAASDSQSMDES